MNEVMNAILTRRSIRKFTADPIPAEVLEDLVKAALHAPSGMGKQTWQFTVVTNQEIIHRLCGLIGTELGREGYDMYGPAAVIIPSNEKESPWGKEDNACAMENIFLAARSYGVGSVWINQMQNINGSPRPVRRDRRSRRPCDLRRSCPGLCGSIRTGGAQGTHRESRVCKIAHKTPPGNAVKRDLNLPVLRRSRRGSLWGRCLKTSLRQRFSIQLDQSKKMSALN